MFSKTKNTRIRGAAHTGPNTPSVITTSPLVSNGARLPKTDGPITTTSPRQEMEAKKIRLRDVLRIALSSDQTYSGIALVATLAVGAPGTALFNAVLVCTNIYNNVRAEKGIDPISQRAESTGPLSLREFAKDLWNSKASYRLSQLVAYSSGIGEALYNSRPGVATALALFFVGTTAASRIVSNGQLKPSWERLEVLGHRIGQSISNVWSKLSANYPRLVRDPSPWWNAGSIALAFDPSKFLTLGVAPAIALGIGIGSACTSVGLALSDAVRGFSGDRRVLTISRNGTLGSLIKKYSLSTTTAALSVSFYLQGNNLLAFAMGMYTVSGALIVRRLSKQIPNVSRNLI